jgi:hypothetical protein
MDLDRVADELYGLDPADFTGRRDALSREARQDGNRDLAGAIKALRKPSMAAYTVNLVVRVRGQEIDRLIELGGRLREAQETLAGEDIRALGRQRSQLIAGVAKQARQEAAGAGHPIGDAVQREVEATLEAALADPEAAAAVRTGRLIRALERTGMEPVDLAGAVAGSTSTGVTGARATAPEPVAAGRGREPDAARAESNESRRHDAEGAGQAEARRQRVETAQAAAEAAEQVAVAAEAARDAAVSEHEVAAQHRTSADAEVQRLSDLLREARDQADRAESDERSARRRRGAAEEGADQARREADRKRGALNDLSR